MPGRVAAGVGTGVVRRGRAWRSGRRSALRWTRGGRHIGVEAVPVRARAPCLTRSNRGLCGPMRGPCRCRPGRDSVACHISWTMLIGASSADRACSSNRSAADSIKPPPVRVQQRALWKHENCISRGQKFVAAAGEKRPPTARMPHQRGPELWNLAL